jgi:hypothetical protein
MTDQEKDPVVNSSLSKPLFISAALLLLSLGWALYDEVYGTRPWKGYEARFEKVYSRFLRQTLPQEAASEQKIKASPEYRDLERQAQAAEKAVFPQVAEIDRKVNTELVPRALALNEPFQEVRGHVGAPRIRSKSPERKQQGIHAQGDRGAEERSPHGEAAHPEWGHRKAADGLRADG